MTRVGNTTQINISIPRELADQIKEIAAIESRSLSNWCAVVLEQAVKEIANGNN